MKQEETRDVENRILEAAKLVFIRKGFEAATMGDIASEAGIGRTSLNYYFRTKEMLFEAILGNLMGMILPNIDQIVNEETPYQEKIRKIVDLYLRTLRKNDLVPLFVVNELQRDPQHLFQSVLKDPERILPIVKLRKLVGAEMQAGQIRALPVIDLVSTFVSLIIFPFLIRRPLTDLFLDGDEAEFEAFLNRRVDFICDIIHHLLKTE
jgi:TetR/AcrR family transcriptional regulator